MPYVVNAVRTKLHPACRNGLRSVILERVHVPLALDQFADELADYRLALKPPCAAKPVRL